MASLKAAFTSQYYSISRYKNLKKEGPRMQRSLDFITPSLVPE